jgi:hypothetical protein
VVRNEQGGGRTPLHLFGLARADPKRRSDRAGA